MNKIELDRLSELTEESLLVEIGTAIFKQKPPRIGAKPPNKKSLIEIAKQWIESKNKEISEVICKNEQLKELVNSEPSFREKVITLIADGLTSYFIFVPCGSVAELIYRSGIKDYCENIWKNDNTPSLK